MNIRELEDKPLIKQDIITAKIIDLSERYVNIAGAAGYQFLGCYKPVNKLHKKDVPYLLNAEVEVIAKFIHHTRGKFIYVIKVNNLYTFISSAGLNINEHELIKVQTIGGTI